MFVVEHAAASKRKVNPGSSLTHRTIHGIARHAAAERPARSRDLVGHVGVLAHAKPLEASAESVLVVRPLSRQRVERPELRGRCLRPALVEATTERFFEATEVVGEVAHIDPGNVTRGPGHRVLLNRSN